MRSKATSHELRFDRSVKDLAAMANPMAAFRMFDQTLGGCRPGG